MAGSKKNAEDEGAARGVNAGDASEAAASKDSDSQSVPQGESGSGSTSASKSGSGGPSGSANVKRDPVPVNAARAKSSDEWSAGRPTLPEFADPVNFKVDPKRVTMLSDVNLRVKIELGRTQMLVEDVLKLGEGSVVELDKLAGDPVDVYVNNRMVARGEILVLNDNFCVRISEVLANDPHRIAT